MSKKEENYVLFRCDNMLLPAEYVAELFALLNKGRPVDYNWSEKLYSFKREFRDADVAVKPFPVEEVRKMEARFALDE